jgi:hypothetical protein
MKEWEGPAPGEREWDRHSCLSLRLAHGATRRQECLRHFIIAGVSLSIPSGLRENSNARHRYAASFSDTTLA